ncbi:MAG: AbrB/MazE/SpoVT family DNA-binding domain-containing protein [Candidatus Heimdallarchaeota archaeon]|nr:AbrB/MazE/SpoVT family DNA-binding domain-containing protein [Candidatus Heimdallarchaeota archaeon]
MAKIIFKRQVIFNKGSLQMNIPKEIVEALGLEKGDTIGITLEDDGFYCRKVKQGEER